MTNLGARYVSQPACRFTIGDKTWIVIDCATGDSLRQFHGKKKSGRMWRGTETDATELCALLNKTVALGTARVQDLDPPDRENAVQWAKIRNRERSTARNATSPSFSQCSTCLHMVKEGHQCTKADIT